jgi:hypothetical protein
MICKPRDKTPGNTYIFIRKYQEISGNTKNFRRYLEYQEIPVNFRKY